MVRRIHVAEKYWNLLSANAKHYQTVYKQSHFDTLYRTSSYTS